MHLFFLQPIFYKACHEFECDTHHMAMAPTVSSCDVFLSCCSEAVSTLWKFNGSNDCTVMKQYEQTDYMAFPHLHSNLALGSEHLHNHNTYDAKLGTVTTAFVSSLRWDITGTVTLMHLVSSCKSGVFQINA